MTLGATPVLYMNKAKRALAGARLLVDAGDAEGACSRAYYAMFDAAHAALTAVSPDLPPTVTKTHRGLVAAFGKILVLSGQVDPAFGRALNQVQELRMAADYIGDPLSLDKAAWAVEQAEAFVTCMRPIAEFAA